MKSFAPGITPNDSRWLSFDFQKPLKGDTIASVLNVSSANGTLTFSEPIINGTIVMVEVSNASLGTITVTVEVSTAGGQVLNRSAFLPVKAFI